MPRGNRQPPRMIQIQRICAIALAMVACDEGSGGKSDPLKISGTCGDGEALSVEGECVERDADVTVFRIDESEVTLGSDSGASPSDGYEQQQSGGSGSVAEACCIFAVDPNGYILFDNWGRPAVLTGACPLPVPWTPGAYGCGCVGANLVINPYTGQRGQVWGQWAGFTCVVD